MQPSATTAHTASFPPQSATFQDLVGRWSDLEAALSLLLALPEQIAQFPDKAADLQQWLQELIAQDTDSGLYLMFQLAGNSTVGYSASHALVCATLSHVLSLHFALPIAERIALVQAAFTMNIGMTALQDQLAMQREPPSPEQQILIRNHSEAGRHLLEKVGVSDKLWLDIVSLHHIHRAEQIPLMQQPAAERLARILATCDRYAAMISPRRTRPARSVTESVHVLKNPKTLQLEQVGQALISSIGLFPPGIYVALSTGETAVVLRRTSSTGGPLVATLLDKQRTPLRQPALTATSTDGVSINHALPSHEINRRVDHQTMARLGAYAANFTDSGAH